MKRRTILSSILVIIACIAVISGTTFALFTSESSVNIAISSGKVNVVATLDNLECYSATANTDGLTDAEIADVAGTITSGPFAGKYYYDKLDGTTFTNNGKAKIDPNQLLKLERVTPGDKVKVNVNIANNSNVKIQYRIRVNVVEGEDAVKSLKLFSGLKTKIAGTEFSDVIRVTAWATINENADITDVPVEIYLPLEAGNEYQDLSTQIKITVEAVQSNAHTASLDAINTILANSNAKNNTMYDAIQEVITADSSYVESDFYPYVWNVDTDRFYDESSIDGNFFYKYFKAYDAKPDIPTYSIYAKAGWNVAEVTGLTVGFDAGNSLGITSITYDRSTESYGRDVVIRTNSASTSLTIDAAADTVKHYGAVGSLNIIAVANMSYHEYGQVAFAEIATGRIVLESGSEVNHIHLNTSEVNSKTVFNNITVAKASDVQMPEFSRDPIEINETEGTLVVALQNGTETTDDKDYVWLTAVGIYEQVVISDKDSLTAQDVEKIYAADSEDQEKKDTAQQIANNITFSEGGVDYKVTATKDGDGWTYEVKTEAGVATAAFEAAESGNTVTITNVSTSQVFTPTTENGLTEEQKESAKNEVVNEAKVIELAEKQATCVHEFDENGVCTKCGLKQALTDAKLVEQGYVVRVVGGDGYMSLAEGMLALHENDTLKVLQDITLTSQTTNGLSAQKCIIDLNGKTITASGTWKLSKTVYEYMTYEDFLELGWGTPTKEEYDADPYPLGMTENPVDVTIMNGTYVVNGTGSGRIRFEKGSTGHFENVIIKSSSDTKTYQGLQTYACNDDGKIEKNLYSFTDCSFENVYLGFEGSAGSCNRYDISFKDCSFDSTTSDNGYNQIYIDDYNYGDLSIDGCQFNLVGNASGGAANCFYIDTYLSYVSGRIVNVTVVDSTFEVFKNANPYSQRFMSYNSVYMDNSSIDISNSTFTKDGKAVEPAIKEQTATNKSLVWVSNAEDFIACYAEWLSYVKSSPACASYSSLNYYLVECNGHYFVMGQGQQYASTAVITMEDDTVVQVLTRLSYGTTYNTIGTTDISSELGENDNANVHIYTLAK